MSISSPVAQVNAAEAWTGSRQRRRKRSNHAVPASSPGLERKRAHAKKRGALFRNATLRIRAKKRTAACKKEGKRRIFSCCRKAPKCNISKAQRDGEIGEGKGEEFQ